MFTVLCNLFNPPQVPSMIQIPPRSTPETPVNSPHSDHVLSRVHPCSPQVTTRTLIQQDIPQPHAVDQAGPGVAGSQDNPPQIQPGIIVSVTFDPSSSDPSRARILRIGVPQLRSSHEPGSPNASRETLRNLTPLIDLLRTLRAPPREHLLRLPEIKEFCRQYFEHMIDAKKYLIKAKIWSKKQLASMDYKPFIATYWIGLARLIKDSTLELDMSKKQVIVFRRQIDGLMSEAKLGDNPKYKWLTTAIVACKQALDALTTAQMRKLTQSLSYKGKESTKKQKPASATLPEVVAFNLITSLKLQIDKQIINLYDQSSPDKVLPEEHQIPWQKVFSI